MALRRSRLEDVLQLLQVRLRVAPRHAGDDGFRELEEARASVSSTS
jgi:hypothetical protein